MQLLNKILNWWQVNSKDWFLRGLVVLVVFSAGLRFYQLGSVPEGIAWDEAAIGYNGYAVATTLRDEWLDVLPISFKSFGDYKAPLAIYLNGLFSVLLGLQPWVIRLPFALSGVAAVLGFALLTKEVWLHFESKLSAKEKVDHAKVYGLLAGVLLSTSPWHLHFSRLAFESGLALTLIIWGVYFWFLFLKRVNFWWLTSSLTLMILSLYTYHSPKIFVPLLLIGLSLLSYRTLWMRLKWSLQAGIWSLLLLLPLAYDSFFGAGATRLSQATIKAENIVQVIFEHFIVHLQLPFLIGGLTPTLRHGDGHWGVLLSTVLLLAIFFLISLFFTEGRKKLNFGLFSIGWIVIGLIPPSIGIDVPHANRALLALPGFLWLAGLGTETLSAWSTRLGRNIRGTHNEKSLVTKSLLGTLVLIHGLLFITYQHDYYTIFANASGPDFQAQSLPTFAYVNQLANDKKIDQILVSNRYGSAYIFILSALKVSPFEHQYGGLVRYKIVDHVNEGHLKEPHSLVVATTEDDMPFEQAVKTFYDQGGHLRYAIFETP